MHDLHLCFCLHDCSCYGLRQDPALDWLLVHFSVAVLIITLFLSVMKKRAHVLFAKCYTGISDFFLFVQGGELVLVPALSAQGRASPSLPIPHSHSCFCGWVRQTTAPSGKEPWKLPELKLCFLSLATNYLCTAKSHTYHYRDFVFYKGKKGGFSCCFGTTSRCNFDTFGNAYENGNNGKV